MTVERLDAERQHRRDGDATAALHPADRLAEIGETGGGAGMSRRRGQNVDH
jgi:hypothetical protein